MIYTCKIYFQQPTNAALMECASLSESPPPPPPIYFPQHNKRTIIIHNKTTAEGYQRSHTAQWTGRL